MPEPQQSDWFAKNAPPPVSNAKDWFAQNAPPSSPAKPGFLGTVAQDIGSMVKPLVGVGGVQIEDPEQFRKKYEAMNPEQQVAQRAETQSNIRAMPTSDINNQERTNYAERRNAGQSPVRAVAETSYEAGAGANMTGFDEAARQGNTAEALGHLAAPVALGAATYGATKIPEVAGAGVEAAGDAMQGAKDSLGRGLRVEPTVDNVPPATGNLTTPKSVKTLKPMVKAVGSTFKIIGGNEKLNALIPDHPVKIGPFRRLATGPVPDQSSPVRTVEPSGGGDPGRGPNAVNLLPEPRATVPSDRPGSMWSIKRSKELPAAAARATPGAGEVLQNIGRPVLYTPREGVGYPGPRSEPADLGPQSQTLKAPSPQPSQTPAIEPIAARDRIQEDLRDYPGNHPGDDTPTETRERQPREQLGNFDADTLQEAKDAIASAHEQWQQFERPGRYVIDTGGEKDYGSDMRRPENSVYSITSARPQMEAAHPWIKNLPKLTSGKLRSAVEAGKGVEYTRLVNEAAGQIQRAKEAAAPVLEEYRGQLEDAAKSVEKVDPDLAQTLRDLAGGKYAGMRGHTAYLREKLNEAATADAFDKVFSEPLSEEISGGAQELGPEAHQPRETNQQAAELGPRKPNNKKAGP